MSTKGTKARLSSTETIDSGSIPFPMLFYIKMNQLIKYLNGSDRI